MLPNLHFVNFINIFNIKMGFLVVATGSCNLIKRRKLLQLHLIQKHSNVTCAKPCKIANFILAAVTSVLILKTFMYVNKHVD